MRQTNNILLSILVSVLLFLFCNAGFAKVPVFVMDQVKSIEYLPYDIEIVRDYNWAGIRLDIERSGQVVKPSSVKDSVGKFVIAYNKRLYEDLPAIFSLYNNDIFICEDDPVNMVVEDWQLCFDPALQKYAAVGVGHRNDTAYLFKFWPDEDSLGAELKFLATAVDSTGDSKWTPDMIMPLIEDYDFDGKPELFIYINTVREGGVRQLFCVQFSSFNIEWDIPVSSIIVKNQFFSCRDRHNPGVIFATYNPAQGQSDSLFTDRYSYVAKIDSSGDVVFNYITSVTHGGTCLIRGENDSAFYLVHEVALKEEHQLKTAGSTGSGAHITKLNINGLIQQTSRLPEIARYSLVHRYNDKTAIYTRLYSGKTIIFDTALNLLAYGRGGTNSNFIGHIRLSGQKDMALVFNNAIYSSDWNVMAVFPFEINSFYPLSYDNNENVFTMIINRFDRSAIVKINKKSLIDLASAFYVNNKVYVLMIMSGLLAGIIVVNYYRIRTRGNLEIIKQQHEELREASDLIALQKSRTASIESYRNASGQFRHEINNALGAVKSYIDNLVNDPMRRGIRSQIKDKLAELDRLLHDYSKSSSVESKESKARIEIVASELQQLVNRLISGLEEVVLKGVNTGLLLAERLRRFERIDYDNDYQDIDLSAIINDVIDEFKAETSKAQNVIENNLERDLHLVGSGDQFRILFRNLLKNSIEALQNKDLSSRKIYVNANYTKGRKIEITWKDTGPGIPAEDLDKIFQPFYTTKPDSGSGLGLAMVQKIVEKYSGTIEIESKLTEFTKFSIVFPEP